MSEPRDERSAGPVFNRAEGANPYSEELTLPLADLYSEPGSGSGSSAYETASGSGYPPAQAPSQQYPPQQYTQQPYQPVAPYPQNSPYQRGGQPWGSMGYAPAEHPQASTVFILALIGFVVPVTPFVAWYMGSKAKREIQQGAPFRYEGNLKIGHIIGLVLSILSIAAIAIYAVIMVFYVVLMVGLFSGI